LWLTRYSEKPVRNDWLFYWMKLNQAEGLNEGEDNKKVRPRSGLCFS
jgi:hypothetical protein